MGDSENLELGNSLQVLGEPSITVEAENRQLERPNKSNLGGQFDINQAIIEPLAGIISGQLPRLFHSSRNQGKMPKG